MKKEKLTKQRHLHNKTVCIRSINTGKRDPKSCGRMATAVRSQGSLSSDGGSHRTTGIDLSAFIERIRRFSVK